MEFLLENWLYIVALVLFVGMHLVGAGGCRPRRDHTGESKPAEDSAADRSDAGRQTTIVQTADTPSIRSWV